MGHLVCMQHPACQFDLHLQKLTTHPPSKHTYIHTHTHTHIHTYIHTYIAIPHPPSHAAAGLSVPLNPGGALVPAVRAHRHQYWSGELRGLTGSTCDEGIETIETQVLDQN